jgi:hypothetical protein
MSFFLTTDQVKSKTKTVTRRIGWKNAKSGDVVQPVVKGQGLKKGERVERIGGPIRFVNVRRERLALMGERYLYDPVLEGFPMLTNQQFIDMFCKHNGCGPDDDVTRIEFEYLP